MYHKTQGFHNIDNLDAVWMDPLNLLNSLYLRSRPLLSFMKERETKSYNSVVSYKA